ncbi:MAG: cryptochrome/photolyase family protein [Gemmatimonadaceae bacterium]|nr:cryptochrome/photolyase family protein [Gemmatimonadaceae bacterium]
MSVSGQRPPTLAFVAPWECSSAVANIPRAPRNDVIIVLLESVAKGASLPWHRQKLVLLLSSMRHFAASLERAGYRVVLRRAASYAEGLCDIVRETGATRVVATEGREQDMVDELVRANDALAALGVALVLREDRGFMATRGEFTAWASGRKEFRMEWFYREMRRKHGILMEPNGQPCGGRWNFDTENRKPWPRGREIPAVWRTEPDNVTREQMSRVATWRNRWGRVDSFALPVTRVDAKAWLERFMVERLPEFGPYEDALVHGQPDLLHSSLSSLLNVGLLHPREVIARAERAWRDGHVPIESAEGFIRQILGWREYIRGMYWHLMPDLRTANALHATMPLPRWFWAPDGEAYDTPGATGDACEMRCLADAIRQVRDHGRVHHIARLMVQCNFATLLGVEPAALSRWYWSAFTDAYEWVELPNVAGMGTWGDGGVLASKPYVSSGAYIKRMSNHCAECRYDVTQRTGPDACPMNTLYWDFLDRHRERFTAHPRMRMMLTHVQAIPAEELTTIRRQATAFRESLAYDRDFAPPIPSVPTTT